MVSVDEEEHDHAGDVASIIGMFLIAMKRAGLLAPCHGCGFPFPTPFIDKDGHLMCPDCELEELQHG